MRFSISTARLRTVRSHRLWRVTAALALLIASAATVSANAAPTPVTTYGYVVMPDGVKLHYMLVLPATGGRFPTVFTYDDYAAGSNGNAVLGNVAGGGTPAEAIGTNYVAHGYAYIGVNLPGTGCSTGVGNIGDVTTWGRDGANVVEWIAKQGWSDGHVGMVGGSFEAMTQLGVAGFRPPHLDAIAPLSATTDFYRDVDYPGGIPNLWATEYPGAAQPGLTAPAFADAAENGQSNCGAFEPGSLSTNVITNEPQEAAAASEHPYYDAFWANDIQARLSNIRIPTFGCLTWQDDAVTSRATSIYLTQLPPATTWFEGNNGGHVNCDLPQGLLYKFFDRFLAGKRNGFEKTPHVLLAEDANGTTPAWYASLNDWQRTVRPVRLYLHSHGLLNSTAPRGVEAADSYRYPTLSPSVADWKEAYDTPDGMVSYTTPALGSDAQFFGPASVDIWLASTTAADTDVQATISEVRPDGQEQYIARGWLRMSHRKLDRSQSSPLRPVHTDLQSDAASLSPGQATSARLQIWPFDHVFRKGSSIKITFDTPTLHQDSSSGLLFQPTPTQDFVFHDPLHVSSILLPLLPDFRAKAPLPTCGSVSEEPCRTSISPVPAGRLSIPAAG